ncbi:hypothetical protein BE21_25785 [Sorangium cellulosum]|uniref:Uncharacterized protein n=1 Tax=Sorangium cellulosum TaxID=56 RepID=A0A150TU21_SORCE|nr:hypothetical protein BE21_25785 [Sorangium cellulosum]
MLRREQHLRPVVEEARRRGELVVLPDIALAEMMKHPSGWEGTLGQSLQILARDPDLVAIAQCSGELLRREHATGQPCTDIIDDEVTREVRVLLRELPAGGPTLARIRTTISNAQRLGQHQHFDNARNRTLLQDLVAAWRSDLRPEDIRALRQPVSREATMRRLLSERSTTVACATALRGGSFNEDDALMLAVQPSASAHNFLVIVALALNWLAYDGLATASGDKLTNDLADMEYVFLATFCRSLTTLETKVQEMDARMRAVIAERARDLDGVVAQILVSNEERVRVAAYFRWLARGKQDGAALDDWLEAERELNVNGQTAA